MYSKFEWEFDSETDHHFHVCQHCGERNAYVPIPTPKGRGQQYILSHVITPECATKCRTRPRTETLAFASKPMSDGAAGMFEKVFINPKWKEKEFPPNQEWKNEIEKWLLFIDGEKQLQRFLPRLNDSKSRRDEALSEIRCAYGMKEILGHSIIDWEAKTGMGGRDAEFIVRVGTEEIFCEVKSPGWESELTQEERLSGRKNQPKYQNAEVRSVGPWIAVRHAIKKSYPKFSPDAKNLVMLDDDYFVSPILTPLSIEIALYETFGSYGEEVGYFFSGDYENVGGILIFTVRLTNQIEYLFHFAPNPHARHSITDPTKKS
jgi:hypothetical protein